MKKLPKIGQRIRDAKGAKQMNRKIRRARKSGIAIKVRWYGFRHNYRAWHREMWREVERWD